MPLPKLKKWSPTQQQLLNKRSIVVDDLIIEIEQDVVSNQDGEANTNRGRPDTCEVGKVLWPGAVFLIEYLSFIKMDWRSVKVLELGCGPGLCGIYLALRGAKCVMTDLENVINLTKRNIDLNFITSDIDTDIDTKIHLGCIPPVAVSYDWHSQEQHISDHLRNPFDVIVAAEVLYERCNFEALLKVIARHSTETTRVYIAYQIRTGAEFEFCLENLSSMGFELGLVETDALPPR